MGAERSFISELNFAGKLILVPYVVTIACSTRPELGNIYALFSTNTSSQAQPMEVSAILPCYMAPPLVFCSSSANNTFLRQLSWRAALWRYGRTMPFGR